MKPTAEFRRFAGRFIQDLHLVAETRDQLFRFVLSPVMGEDRERLRAFLDTVTKDGVRDEDVQTLWNSTPAEIYFLDAGELRAMLKEARDRLGGERFQPHEPQLIRHPTSEPPAVLKTVRSVAASMGGPPCSEPCRRAAWEGH